MNTEVLESPSNTDSTRIRLSPLSWFSLRFMRFLQTGGQCIRWSKYKWKKIENTIHDKAMLDSWGSRELPFGFGKFLDERIVEYPALFYRLKDLKGAKVLDAGSTANFKEIVDHPSILQNDLTVVTLAHESQDFCEKGISYVFDDLRALPFRDENFDFVFSISTIEHVGMNNTRLYTDEAKYRESKSEDFLLAVEEFERVLKKGGRALITVPCGKKRDLGWLQIFDLEMIQKVVKRFGASSHTVQYYRNTENGWKEYRDFEGVANSGFSSQIVPEHSDNPFNFFRPGAEAVAIINLVK